MVDMMTMTTADLSSGDGLMGPRADRPKRRVFTAGYKAAILAVNRPGMSGDSKPWEGWSHAREHIEEVPA